MEKKVDKLTGLVEDLTLTPQQYLKLVKVNKAVEKGLDTSGDNR